MPQELSADSVNKNLQTTSNSEVRDQLISLLLEAQNLADNLNYPLVSIHLNEAIEAARLKNLDESTGASI